MQPVPQQIWNLQALGSASLLQQSAAQRFCLIVSIIYMANCERHTGISILCSICKPKRQPCTSRSEPACLQLVIRPPGCHLICLPVRRQNGSQGTAYAASSKALRMSPAKAEVHHAAQLIAQSLSRLGLSQFLCSSRRHRWDHLRSHASISA